MSASVFTFELFAGRYTKIRCSPTVQFTTFLSPPPHHLGRTLHLLLVKNATTSSAIRKKLLAGELEVAVLNARMVSIHLQFFVIFLFYMHMRQIVGAFQVVVAANKVLSGMTHQMF